ncbi:MAG TPA: shikimate kinase, partial [Thermomicrobiales bacterium]|nr:shikimate kinase [Thermomicrobiales bacterium]
MRNIYLTGFMGSGKSAVGARLAARLGRPYRDLDATIVAGAGMTIPAIFAQEGEAAFRRREADALRRVAAEGGQVVATGGGIVADAANREVMRASGWIVCLEARPETLYARVRAQAGEDDLHSARPLLAAPDPLARIRDLKASRQPAYADADWTVHTDGLGVDEVADEVARAVARLER